MKKKIQCLAHHIKNRASGIVNRCMYTESERGWQRAEKRERESFRCWRLFRLWLAWMNGKHTNTTATNATQPTTSHPFRRGLTVSSISDGTGTARSGDSGGGQSSMLSSLFRCFVHKSVPWERCWLQIPVWSEPDTIIHEVSEVSLTRYTQCAWGDAAAKSARLNCTIFTPFSPHSGSSSQGTRAWLCFGFLANCCNLLQRVGRLHQIFLVDHAYTHSEQSKMATEWYSFTDVTWIQVTWLMENPRHQSRQ